MTEIKRFYMRGVIWPSNDGSIVSYKDHSEIVAVKDARIAELERGDVGGALMERELRHSEVTGRMVQEINALQEQVRALAAENAIQDFIISAVKDLVRESEGVSGWHLNGDIASWDKALPELNHSETPATDAAIREIRAQARAEGIYFAANRLLAAWESGFVDDTPAAAHDISGAILSAVEFLPNADEGEFKRDYADEVRARIKAGEQP